MYCIFVLQACIVLFLLDIYLATLLTSSGNCLFCRFALAFTLYFPMMNIMAYYCHDYPTFRSFWFATINSNNMWYCFLKAWCNVVVSKFTKKQSGFKVSTQGLMIMPACFLKGSGT